MNILLINHYAGSPKMGMEFRPYYLAKEWIKKGHRVDIISADYSHLRRINPKVQQDFQKEVIDGINYYWIKTNQYKKNGIKRSFTMFKFVLYLWIHSKRIVKNLNPDVVICSSTYPLDTYVGQKIKKISKKKVRLIHEVHDMWPLTLIEIGKMSPKNPFVIIMQIAENSAYKNSDKVVSLLPYAKEYMVSHGLKPEKFIHISNGVVKKEWENSKSIPQKHQELFYHLRQNNNFIVGYFGGHALSNALDNLIKAAQKMQNTKTVFVLVGDGIEKCNLQEYVKNNNINNVFFLPPIEKEGVPQLVANFDCIYMGLHKSPLYRFGICMNKLYDSMMAKKPILYAIDSPNNYIEEYQCGITVDPSNIEEYVNAIRKIKNLSKDTQENMGINGKNAVLKHFEYNVLANKFLNIMQENN